MGRGRASHMAGAGLRGLDGNPTCPDDDYGEASPDDGESGGLHGTQVVEITPSMTSDRHPAVGPGQDGADVDRPQFSR